MSRVWGFLVFLLVFHSLYFGMNFYVLARLAGLFGINLFYRLSFVVWRLIGVPQWPSGFVKMRPNSTN